jgi:SAM-dependent methyltransferase
MGPLSGYVQARRYLLERRRARTAGARLARLRSRWQGPMVPRAPRAPTDSIVDADRIDRARRSQPGSHEIVIADIDQDGFLCSRIGRLHDVPTVTRQGFAPRGRFDLTVVDVRGGLGVKKHFKEDVVAFLAELEAGRDLHAAGCRVPAIVAVDFDELTITSEFIPGRVVREELARRGAILRDRDVAVDPTYRGLTPTQRRARRVEQGRAVLGDVVDTETVELLFSEIKKIHEAGYVLHDVKFGNVILEATTGEPYLIDFDRARRYPELGRLSRRLLRDRDYQKFNTHFGTQKLTHRRAVGWSKRPPDHLRRLYSPIHIEGGLNFGNIWRTDAGYGRWRSILRDQLPSVAGARVLDLGANNGFNAIQMLRVGAREVVAVERDDRAIAQARAVTELFEWADGRSYALTYVHEDVAALPRIDLGRFDLVTALCSIYYLSDEDIPHLVRHISTITDMLVLQCNTDRSVHRSDQHTFAKASVAYAVAALEQNGFPFIRVVAPRGYSRPLVIGRRRAPSALRARDRAATHASGSSVDGGWSGGFGRSE